MTPIFEASNILWWRKLYLSFLQCFPWHIVSAYCTSTLYQYVFYVCACLGMITKSWMSLSMLYLHTTSKSLHDVMCLLFRLLSSCSLDWGNNPFTICLSEVCTVLFFPGYFSLALLCVKITILLIVEICPHNITVSHLFISTSIKKIGNFQLK